MTVRTNNGAVVNLIRSNQLDGGSQDKCGPWSVSELKYGKIPPEMPIHTASDVGKWASQEYELYIGPDVLSNQDGSSINNMYEFLRDANLFSWDIAAINPSSTQASDIAHITAALKAGYPVLVTVNEQSVVRRDGSNPYAWQPALGPVNHVFTLVGYTNGFYLVDDELNQTDAWPIQYNANALECHWASVVQMPGLDAIPSGDPTTWPSGFNAQLPAGGVPTIVQTYSTKSADFKVFFTAKSATSWQTIKGNFTIQSGLLAGYCKLSVDGNSLPIPGLPVSNEMYTTIAGKSIAYNVCERLVLFYDPTHVVDKQPGMGDCTLMKLTDPRLLTLIPGLALPIAGIPPAILTDAKVVAVALEQLMKDIGV